MSLEPFIEHKDVEVLTLTLISGHRFLTQETDRAAVYINI